MVRKITITSNNRSIKSDPTISKHNKKKDDNSDGESNANVKYCAKRCNITGPVELIEVSYLIRGRSFVLQLNQSLWIHLDSGQ